MLLRNISYPELINVLNSYTKKFIRFLLLGASRQELDQCKKMLDTLIVELKRRRRSNPALQRNIEQENFVMNMMNDRALRN